MSTRVSLSVVTDDQETITRAMEALSRAGAGLALEGVSVFLMAGPESEDE
jgi:hypothetical protein